MNFVRDCLSRELTLHQVADKYGISIDDIMDKYHEERSKLTDEEVDVIMNEVYYKI